MKPGKKFCIAIAILSAVISALSVSGYLLVRKELRYFRTVETGRLGPDLFAIKDDFVNVFLLEKNGAYLAVDSGNTGKNILEGFEALGIDIKKVSTLLLTHTDYDHVAQVDLYDNAEIYISSDEEQMINGQTEKKFFIHNKLAAGHGLLPDGSIRKIDGWTVQTIVVPGHTAGSACFIIDGKYLFTGDNISLIEGKAGPFNDLFNTDTRRQMGNIPKIAHLNDISLVLTAHYGISDRYDSIFSEW